MTLIITAAAAVVATVVWFVLLPNNRFRIGVLALIYWAASLMWCVDGFANLFSGEPFIELHDAAVMSDDALLGGIVVLIGLAVWVVYLVVRGLRHPSPKTP